MLVDLLVLIDRHELVQRLGNFVQVRINRPRRVELYRIQSSRDPGRIGADRRAEQVP